MDYEQTRPEDDADYFGKDAWIYCRSHMRPHHTGWCTVGLEGKCKLFASSYEEAVKRCRYLGLPLTTDS